ncbi:MAG: hypothetical protein ACLSVX_02215 [Massilimicrobiota timonensis]
MNYKQRKEIMNELQKIIQKNNEELYKEIETIKKEKNYKKINKILTWISLCASIITGCCSLWIGFEANKIANTSNEINSRQEPTIINYIESDEEIIYEITNNDRKYVAYSKKPAIQLIQGSLTELYGIICFDKKIQIIEDIQKEQKEKLSTMKGTTMQWGPKENYQLENNKTYDYAFVYLKDGNGNDYVNLVYVEIEYKNGEFICSNPKKVDEIELLQYINGYQYENTIFKKMIEDYQYVLEMFKDVRNKE